MQVLSERDSWRRRDFPENVSCNVKHSPPLRRQELKKRFMIPFRAMSWHSKSAGLLLFAEKLIQIIVYWFAFFCLHRHGFSTHSCKYNSYLPRKTNTRAGARGCTHTRAHTLSIGHFLRTEHLMAVCDGGGKEGGAASWSLAGVRRFTKFNLDSFFSCTETRRDKNIAAKSKPKKTKELKYSNRLARRAFWLYSRHFGLLHVDIICKISFLFTKFCLFFLHQL